MPGYQHLAIRGVILLALSFAGRTAADCRVVDRPGVDLAEIVSRGSAAIQADWDATTFYAVVERDEFEKNGKLNSKTFQVVIIDGSDYYLPLAVDDQPLVPEQRKVEVEKLRHEVRRRAEESPPARSQRLANYRKQREENGALLLEFPQAFTFGLVQEETRNGFPAYKLSAMPRKRTGPMSRAAKVLAGTKGMLWIERDNFHPLRAEGDVTTPVPIYGILAEVLPGTHLEFEMAPVTSSTWLISSLSMKLRVSKFFLFRSTRITRSTYSGYRPNDAVLAELLSSAE